MLELTTCPNCLLQFPAEGRAQCPDCGSAIGPDEKLPAAPKSSRSVPRQRAHEPYRPQKTKYLVPFFIVGGLLVLTAVGITFAVVREKQRARKLASEDPIERVQELKDAFRNTAPLDPGTIAPEVDPLFAELGAAFAAADRNRLMNCFDVDRMIEEFGDLGPGIPRNAFAKRDFASGVRTGLSNALMQNAAIMKWNRSDIRKIKSLNAGEAVIIVRHEDDDDTTIKMRWWLTRRNGTWRIYDYEDLDVGMRFSVTVASLLQNNDLNKLVGMQNEIRAIHEAIQAVTLEGDIDGAEDRLQKIPVGTLPNEVEALHHMVQAMIHLRRAKYEETHASAAKARAIRPDMPVLDLLQAMALNRLGRWEEALKFLKAYQDLLGEDAIIASELGLAFRGNSRFVEAAAAYRRSLDRNPKNAEAYQGLLNSLEPTNNLDDLGARFLKLDNRRENFDALATDCAGRETPELLEPILAAMVQTDPEYPPVSYYRSLAKARANLPKEAVLLFKKALEGEKDKDLRNNFVQGFLKAMAATGAYAKAYAAVPDAASAFEYLTEEAMKSYRTEEFAALVAAHSKKDPNDPMLPWYRGEIHVRQERYALAEKLFAAAIIRLPKPESLDRFRSSRVLARYHTDRAMSAYSDIGPRAETFTQLAWLAYHNNNDAVLEKLLNAHAKNEPADTTIPMFRIRLDLRKGKTAEAITLFKTTIEKSPMDDTRETLIDSFLMSAAQAGCAAEAYVAVPDGKAAFRTLASELKESDNYSELRRLIPAHRAKHPDDPWLAFEEADVLSNDKEWAKAAELLIGAMKTAAPELRTRFAYTFAYTMHRAGRSTEVYAMFPDRRKETFAQLSGLMAEDSKPAELEALIASHREHAGEEPAFFLAMARAKALAGRPDEAMEPLKKAWQLEPEEYQKKWYNTLFIQDMDKIGRVLDGYRLAPDPIAAFDSAASRLLNRKNDKELNVLIELHMKSNHADPFLDFYRGEIELLRGDAAAAVSHFGAAMARATPQQLWRFRFGLFKARVKAGSAAASYRESLEKDFDAFDTLANICVQEKDTEQLRGLIEALRRNDPDSLNIPFRELEVLWLERNFEGAWKLLNERQNDCFELSRFRWRAEEYRIRCLVRLKREKDALREVEAMAKRNREHTMMAILAKAASGDVNAVMAEVEKESPQPETLRSYYEDDDLGPILKSDAFRTFREKYPVPAKDANEH